MKRTDTTSPHTTINAPWMLANWLQQQQNAAWVALDTEFISERRYIPTLCLLQVATPDTLAIIDPFTCGDLTAFWRFLCDGTRDVIVHAARSEMEFCCRAIGEIPSRIIDVQLAAAFLAIDYPASFGTLVHRVLGVQLSKDETRTDWARRPFTPQQLRYALDDVRYLDALATHLRSELTCRNRLAWFDEESRVARDKLIKILSGEQWRGVARSSGLPPLGQAIVRSLWELRDEWGYATNQPAQYLLRDDVIVELAKRRSIDPVVIASLRGVPKNRKYQDQIVAAMADAMRLPETEWPKQTMRNASYPQYASAISFLHTVLTSLCRREDLSPMVVATSSDLREWVAHCQGTLPPETVPRLSGGWRRNVIVPTLEGVLTGRLAIRLKDSGDESEMVELISTEHLPQ